MATAPLPRREPEAPYDRTDDEVAAALGVYAVERIGRRSRLADVAGMELPSGRPTAIDVDAVISLAVEVLEAVDEPLAAMCVVYVAAYRCGNPGRIRDALFAMADCGPKPVGFAEAARRAAVETIHGKPTIAAEWGPDDRVEIPLARGDVVRDAYQVASAHMTIVDLSTDAESGAVLALCEFTNSAGRLWRVRLDVRDLVRVPRPTIEPTGPLHDGGTHDGE